MVNTVCLVGDIFNLNREGWLSALNWGTNEGKISGDFRLFAGWGLFREK
jgi:hypothetical protein